MRNFRALFVRSRRLVVCRGGFVRAKRHRRHADGDTWKKGLSDPGDSLPRFDYATKQCVGNDPFDQRTMVPPSLAQAIAWIAERSPEEERAQREEMLVALERVGAFASYRYAFLSLL